MFFKKVRISHQASDHFYNPMQTPQSQGQTRSKRKPLSFLGLGELWLIKLLFYRKDHFKPLKRDFNV
ncbi:hypothetical protein ECC30_02335 [Helicobacter pylori]|nr:hypothetical protein ECC28_06045 [Helicobacter pylori]RVY57457.1 hypothetical protein ECC30_02335 [Helicobacter pylori]RVY98226.1 hypothetical protein EC517_01000 [Helicobacter pylori]